MMGDLMSQLGVVQASPKLDLPGEIVRSSTGPSHRDTCENRHRNAVRFQQLIDAGAFNIETASLSQSAR